MHMLLGKLNKLLFIVEKGCEVRNYYFSWLVHKEATVVNDESIELKKKGCQKLWSHWSLIGEDKEEDHEMYRLK